MITFQGRPLVAGRGQGPVLFSAEALSFWGGVDAATGMVIDRHHPLCGQSIADKVLVLPSGRGSCTGSAVMLQLLSSDHAPAAILICEKEEIITLGVVIAEKFFSKRIPVVRLSREDFLALARWNFAVVNNGVVSQEAVDVAATSTSKAELKLSDADEAMLSGAQGEAARLAMEVIVTMSEVYGATELLDITQAHIDGCIYTGDAGLGFAEHLAEVGAHVKVPTTLNAISVDRRMWRSLGVNPEFGDPSERLADAYVTMGARPTYTCAPYLLDSKPDANAQVAWGESNAVIYANSVLGARTLKYPDYLDICIAITGRAPRAGTHTDEGRQPQLKINVEEMPELEDAFYPLLGYHLGHLCGPRIPLIAGLKKANDDDLKAFSAAFGTTSAAPMFYMTGITPTPKHVDASTPSIEVSKADLAVTWSRLHHANGEVDLIALGNPHFSQSEFHHLAALCEGRKKHGSVKVIVTCGRDVHKLIKTDGTLARLTGFGLTILNDTCWCMIEKPVIPHHTKFIGTNSGKYVHYGPGISGITVRLGSLKDCVSAAVTGHWLATE